MATVRSEITSDEIVYIKCSLCVAENRTREAQTYCVECKDYYCRSCVDLHKKFPSMKEHNLLGKADFGSLETDGSLPSFPTQRCSVHPSKIVDMYCEDHDTVACGLCIAMTHRQCYRIHSVPEEVDSLYQPENIADAKSKLSCLKKIFENICLTKETEIERLQASLDEAVDDVITFRKELDAILDNIQQETITEMKKKHADISCDILRKKDSSVREITLLNEAIYQIRKAEGNKAQEFVSSKMSKKILLEGDVMKANVEKKNNQTISFSADECVKSIVGTLKTFPQYFQPKRSTLYKVKNRRKINIFVKEDKYDCRNIGSCILGDGSVLLVDNDNGRLKRVNIFSETVVDHITLTSGPRAVCRLGQHEAIVTLSRAVGVISLAGNMTITKSVSFDHFCYGIAVVGDDVFISNTKDVVFIHKMDGRELKRVTTDTSGQNIFQRSRHIVASGNGKKVFITDDIKGLISLDVSGNYVNTHKYKTVSRCQGVCTDGTNLFICDFRSGNILQLDKDCKLIGKIAEVGNPLSISFDEKKKRLVVTKNYNNSITVLDLVQK